MRARGGHLNANYDILLIRMMQHTALLHRDSRVVVLWVKFNNTSNNNNNNPPTHTILINANVQHVNQIAHRM